MLDDLPTFTVQAHQRGKRRLKGEGTTTIIAVYSHWLGGRAIYLDTTFDYSAGRAKEVFEAIPRSVHRVQGYDTFSISYSTGYFTNLEGAALNSNGWGKVRDEVHQALARVATVPKLTRLGRSPRGHGWSSPVLLPLLYATGLAIQEKPMPAEHLAAIRRRREHGDGYIPGLVDEIIKAVGLPISAAD